MPLRNGLTKARSFSKRYSYNDKKQLVKLRSSSVVSSMVARGRINDKTGKRGPTKPHIEAICLKIEMP